MNKSYFITRKIEKIMEGGVARDSALEKFLLKKGTEIVEMADNRSYKNKLINLMKNINIFCKNKNEIVILYPFVGAPLKGLKILRKTYLFFLKRAAKNNKVIFDVSDLPLERAVSLEFEIPHFYEEVEKVIFGIEARYVFASYSMRDYIVKKYRVKEENTSVCINGGNRVKDEIKVKKEIDEFISKDKINYVYAGTLARGRRIEQMLEIFKANKNVTLSILGINGEWINEYIQAENIRYFGAFPEDEAQKIVSMCDVGLMPYDETTLNNSIIYPIKMSFYITAGITFIATKMNELVRLNKNYGIGYTENMESWAEVINGIDREKAEIEKEKVRKVKKEFEWEEILNKYWIF